MKTDNKNISFTELDSIIKQEFNSCLETAIEFKILNADNFENYKKKKVCLLQGQISYEAQADNRFAVSFAKDKINLLNSIELTGTGLKLPTVSYTILYKDGAYDLKTHIEATTKQKALEEFYDTYEGNTEIGIWDVVCFK